MGLIQKEILELRELVVAIREDKIPTEKVSSIVSVYSQISKRTSQLIQIESMHIKSNGKSKTWRKMNELNLVSDGNAIPVDEDIVIKCPAMGWKLIDQESCLDYSGKDTHLEYCQGCKHFGITRRALLPT